MRGLVERARVNVDVMPVVVMHAAGGCMLDGCGWMGVTELMRVGVWLVDAGGWVWMGVL